MWPHVALSRFELRKKIREAEITLGGNRKAKIYGSLRCLYGKKMKKENRVFFATVLEAERSGYRPCARCMNAQYKNWKHESV